MGLFPREMVSKIWTIWNLFHQKMVQFMDLFYRKKWSVKFGPFHGEIFCHKIVQVLNHFHCAMVKILNPIHCEMIAISLDEKEPNCDHFVMKKYGPFSSQKGHREMVKIFGIIHLKNYLTKTVQNLDHFVMNKWQTFWNFLKICPENVDQECSECRKLHLCNAKIRIFPGEAPRTPPPAPTPYSPLRGSFRPVAWGPKYPVCTPLKVHFSKSETPLNRDLCFVHCFLLD